MATPMMKIQNWLAFAVSLSRSTKRLVMLGADIICIPLVMWAALGLGAGAPVSASVAWSALAAALVACIPVFIYVGLYRAVLRFIGPRAALAISLGVLVAIAVLYGLVAAGVLGHGFASITIFGFMLLVYVGGSRMLLRWLLLSGATGRSGVVIYGAGSAGIGLASALRSSDQYRTVAFVDDNANLQDTFISGLPVYAPDELPIIIHRHRVRRVLLAIPVLSRRRRREILDRLEPLGVHVQSVPSIERLVAGIARVDELQDVEVADLLGRDAVPPNAQLLGACIQGKVVLVSGAGGSIGSELCRQIVRLAPRKLLLLEMSELALYNIERELRMLAEREGNPVEILPLLGNAHHKYRVREILQTFAVETVYHAAAYKHVPIVEQNIIEGLHNNVFSTWHAAEASLECHVETFVLISTDKAVNPTNVMGATKRLAEIVLQGLQQRSARTRFCMVRFGNVLESSGSVVPLFREQIRRGGPVTVTHADVTRYFMTIPEAAQLVIQAGAMAGGGDVFVLDMGKPIRIADLARRMIQLSGLTVREEDNPEGDVEIRFTGLRPAEKLFEELLIGRNVTGTEHPMIMRAVEHALPWEDVQGLLESLGVAMRRFDCAAARDLLQRAVAEYRPALELQDIVWTRRGVSAASLAIDSKVTDLQSRRSRVPPS